MDDKKRGPDVVLFSLAIALLVIGVVMVYDASFVRASQGKFTGGDNSFYVKRQAMWAAIGLVLMFTAMRIRYWRLRPLWIIAVLAGIGLLVFVFVPGRGVTINGATRWTRICGITIQPSEFAKIALIVYLAALFSVRERLVRDFRRGLLPALAPLVLMAGLIMKQPDMGTTLVLAMVTFVMLWSAGARKRHLLSLFLVGLVLFTIFARTADYRWRRVTSFIDPFKYYYGDGYQVCQSLMALGSGRILGGGICKSREKWFYLPAEHTDFIFSVLGEEAGLLGTLTVATIFLLFGIRGFAIAGRTKDCFGKFLAVGLSSLISGQALLNMLVVTSSVPATGVPLPFVSYGGSSLSLNLLSVGILLSISRYRKPVESHAYANSINGRRNRGPRVSGPKYR